MENDSKLKKMISGLYLTIISGDIHARIQHVPTLIDYLSIWIRENADTNKNATRLLWQELADCVAYLVANAPIDRACGFHTSKKQPDVANEFLQRINILTSDDKEIVTKSAGVIRQLESLERARSFWRKAAEAYSLALAGNPGALTGVSLYTDDAMSIITRVVMELGLCDFSESEFKASVARKAVS
ncbi:MAG: hypothetical protein WCX22_01900 [Methanoregula sp.]